MSVWVQFVCISLPIPYITTHFMPYKPYIPYHTHNQTTNTQTNTHKYPNWYRRVQNLFNLIPAAPPPPQVVCSSWSSWASDWRAWPWPSSTGGTNTARDPVSPTPRKSCLFARLRRRRNRILIRNISKICCTYFLLFIIIIFWVLRVSVFVLIMILKICCFCVCVCVGYIHPFISF